MRVIISPAKKMLAGNEAFAVRNVPALSGRAAQLLDALSALDRDELQALWNVSDKLLEPCLRTLDDLKRDGIPTSEDDLFDPAFSTRVSPAVLAYAGIQYQSMAPGVMDEGALDWLQGHLRILSGFYGCLRPFDAVLPYRLEMGARLAVDGTCDLYGFWSDAIAHEVCSGEVDTIVNLASVEYARAVTPHLPDSVCCVTCLFGEDARNGRPLQRSTASKTARGSMVRWMAERGVKDVGELAAFDVGYRLEEGMSGVDTLVFLREG